VERGEGIQKCREFVQATEVPPSAADCLCQGGCASRRALLGVPDGHDPYCPWIRGESVDLHAVWAEDKGLVRSRNYCTTIVT
jgi:hypothetical protein